MTKKIINHPAVDREDKRHAALQEMLEDAQEASFPGMIAHTALLKAQRVLASQKTGTNMDRETQVARMAEHMIATYGERALEYSKRIASSSDNPEFALAVTEEIQRKTSEPRVQP